MSSFIALGTACWQRSRILLVTFAAAAGVSVFTQAVGAYCYPKGLWDNLPVSVDSHPERLWDWRDNPVARTLHGGFAWEPYALMYDAVTQGPEAARKRIENLRF